VTRVRLSGLYIGNDLNTSLEPGTRPM